MPLNPPPAPDSTQSRIIRMTDKEFAKLTTFVKSKYGIDVTKPCLALFSTRMEISVARMVVSHLPLREPKYSSMPATSWSHSTLSVLSTLFSAAMS